ncbi:RNA 2',3'-cyclic phosphodiesterase [Geomonas paludis]|uniref:RNA 2',3'-cyclic phosphodiesterase n=1 Tax=Geomonas paludis TaxID=2740185 RepID=A0A6V8MRQ9_9BACT|nr:RNA 2',3'-cyclic phosphodiesterase [Geomonas paludis]UPU36071.1 RNA 2',3'-cyclic phosphodiesterase [Geomonas paludis]GFO62323.1 RNA 2',3'-cyclic phosphodiesterase [Geomonas paludis]
MARLFIAIELPDDIKATLSSLGAEVPGPRWVPPDQIHLTLRFLGDVLPQTGAVLKQKLSAVSFTSFPLTLRGVGHFPPHGHPRVLWVGLDESRPLLTLQQQIESAVTGAGIPPEQRGFSPHITLARIKENASAEVARFEATHRTLSFPPFNVEEFILFSSVLTPKGAIHRKEDIYRCS